MRSLSQLIERINPLPSWRVKMKKMKEAREVKLQAKLQAKREKKERKQLERMRAMTETIPYRPQDNEENESLASMRRPLGPPRRLTVRNAPSHRSSMETTYTMRPAIIGTPLINEEEARAELRLHTTSHPGVYRLLPPTTEAATTAENNLQRQIEFQRQLQEQAALLEHRAAHFALIQNAWEMQERRRDAELRALEAAMDAAEAKRERKMRKLMEIAGERERMVADRERSILERENRLREIEDDEGEMKKEREREEERARVMQVAALREEVGELTELVQGVLEVEN
ncbi:hypothetical protein EDC01DRAFT_634589 [Geopyxis carbonaria]|nr:hypothetical protein EDC01DRAFT_634589 [Geopyxis carbonaria]